MSFSLFVGDLSIYCTREELENVFSTFGPIRDIRIKKDEHTGKNLSYGFIDFDHVDSAVNVLKCMNGYVLCGRPMRVRWAANKAKGPTAGSGPIPSQNASNETSAIHVTYTTLQPNVVVTEESLRWMFNSYGYVVDATVKKATFTQDHTGRKGYGFVHYANSMEGVDSALRAVAAMTDVIFNDVHYKCCLSKNLETKLNSMYNPPSPVMVPSPTQPMTDNGYNMNYQQQNYYQQPQQQEQRQSPPQMQMMYQMPSMQQQQLPVQQVQYQQQPLQQQQMYQFESQMRSTQQQQPQQQLQQLQQPQQQQAVMYAPNSYQNFSPPLLPPPVDYSIYQPQPQQLSQPQQQTAYMHQSAAPLYNLSSSPPMTQQHQSQYYSPPQQQQQQHRPRPVYASHAPVNHLPAYRSAPIARHYDNNNYNNHRRSHSPGPSSHVHAESKPTVYSASCSDKTTSSSSCDSESDSVLSTAPAAAEKTYVTVTPSTTPVNIKTESNPVDELQAKLDNLRVCCGIDGSLSDDTAHATASIHVDTEELVHDTHDY